MPIAIIGMSCRFPGAENLNQYWQMLSEGKSGISEVPPHRLDSELFYSAEKGVMGKTYSRLCGLVPERPIDLQSYPTLDDLIKTYDQTHLTMLEVAAEAFRHAGLDPFALTLKNTGVYIGHARTSPLSSKMCFSIHIEEIAQNLDKVDAFKLLPGDVQGIIKRTIVDKIHNKNPFRRHNQKLHTLPHEAASIISDAFGLSGPYMAVDAACASSLYALQTAANALLHGRIAMAVVGGAANTNWQSLILFSQAQALSANGSFPFDSRADGFISSDGYAAILIKTLGQALADGDTIYGVIRGIGISNDGHGKSLWAPRKEGQIEAIKRAYTNHMNPGRIQYIEAHGTSTQLGDATEIEALAAVFGDCFLNGTKIPIASVKANIGHTLETSGLAGLIKILLSMQHETIPAAINFQHPSPKIDWENIPFFVPKTKSHWPVHEDGYPRCAAMDSFGIGGLNVHLVVEQYSAEKSSEVFIKGTPNNNDNTNAELNDNDNAIAIIGMGTIFPGARSLSAFWDLIKSGNDPRSNVGRERWNADIYYEKHTQKKWRSSLQLGGFITGFNYDWEKHKIPPKQLETADPLQFILLDAVEQALCSAGYDKKPFDRTRTGVVVGTMFGNDFAGQLNLALHLPEVEQDLRRTLLEQGVPGENSQQILKEFREIFLAGNTTMSDETGSYSSSTLASRIARTLDLMGGAFSLDSGEASSLASLCTAVDLLLSGQCNMIICAGGQRTMDIFSYDTYAKDGLLSSGSPAQPFDINADGFVPGEGAGVLLLKRLCDAKKDEDQIYAVVRGIGAATNTNSIGDAIHKAIETAATMPGVDAKNVGMVEAIGIGINEIDKSELDALANIYGAIPRQYPLYIGTITGQIGHTLGASGMASLIKTILAFKNGEFPANFTQGNASTPIINQAANLRLLSGPVQISSLIENGRGFAGVTSLAFRGLAYHVLIEPGTYSQPAVDTIFRISGKTPDDLIKRMSDLQVDPGSLMGMANMSCYHSDDRARIAIVFRDSEDFAQKLKLASSHAGRPGLYPVLTERGVFYHILSEEKPRLALIFSGLGSQYPGMLRELVREVPAAADKLKEIDELMLRLGYPTFSGIAWSKNEDLKLGSDAWSTQMSVLFADTICYAALRDMGITPSVISGHSYGEFPALVAAGAWTLEQAIRLTNLRSHAIDSSEKARGALLSTTAPLNAIHRLAKKIKGNIYLANHNAPDQTIVGGDKDSVAEFEILLAARGFENKTLPVPSPFHTPLMADAQEQLRQGLEKEKFFPPHIPFLSSITNRYTSEPADISRNLGKQLTTPVRYVDLIEKLLADEIKIIVEVGPRQVLTRLHRRIAKDRDIVAISCDNPKSPGKSQLIHVKAMLECHGILDHTDGQHETGGEKTGKAAAKSDAVHYEIIHFDATQHRKNKKRQMAEAAPYMPAKPEKEKELSAPDELESFLVNFICEQTGYPPEIVDLDADLESDLGIDSIKKAQLLGELREDIGVEINRFENISLDDFSTLRHIVEFIRKNSAKGGPILPAPVTTSPGTTSPGTPAMNSVQDIEGLNIVKCSGTPYEMGYQHGQSQKDQIDLILKEYCGQLGIQPAHVKEFIDSLPLSDSYFDQEGMDELRGLADSMEIPLENLMAYNLGLYPNYAPGCCQFAFPAKHNGSEGMIHGANEDWPLTLKLKNCLTRIVQLRYPADGIPHLLFCVPGQLGGINGINTHGIAVSSTLLLDRPFSFNAPNGKIHSVIVKAILKNAEDIESAVKIVKNFQKIGAWSLCISHHPTDSIVYIEYDGPEINIKHPQDVIMSTNHCLLLKSAAKVPDHSLFRSQRLQALLAGNGKLSCSVDLAKDALRDRYDLDRRQVTKHATMNTIQRIDNHISIVMQPGHGRLWVTPGPFSKGNPDSFYRLDLEEVFASGRHSPGQAHGAANRLITEAAKETTHNRQPGTENSPVMNRFILRMRESSREKMPGRADHADHADHAALFHGPVLILGKNLMAQALGEYLKELGATVLELPGSNDYKEAISCLEKFWQLRPTPHLFIMTAFDGEARGEDGNDRIAWREDFGVLTPYFVCQHWLSLVYKENIQSKASLVAVTGLGGDFGFSGKVNGVEGGGLAGLCKAIRREYNDLLVKVIDVPPDESPQLAAVSVCNEMAMGEAKVEVGYVGGKRFLVQAIPRAVTALKRGDIPVGGTWVATGGGRGITAFAARELGRRFGLRLHLIGASPLPEIDQKWLELSKKGLKELKLSIARQAHQDNRDPAAEWGKIEKAIEIKKNLTLLSKEGVTAVYHSCDISDEKALAGVLDQVRKADGPIQGIIHGAGVESAARYERKTAAGVRATIRAKVVGAAHLMNLTRGDAPGYFVAFGSVSGRFGGLGQTDYSMASDMLAKLVHLYRAQRPGCAAVCIHWPAWDEIGMAMRPGSKLALKASEQKFMPPLEGVEHLAAELRAGAPEGEIVILDRPGTLDLDGIVSQSAQHPGPLKNEKVTARYSLIDRISELHKNQSLLAEANFNPVSDPFLSGHRFQGLPILPAVIALEAMAQGAAALSPGQIVIGLRNVEIKNGLRFFTHQPQMIKINALLKNNKEVECEIYGDFYNRKGKMVDPHRVYSVGAVELSELGDKPAEIKKCLPAGEPREWHEMEYMEKHAAGEDAFVFHGAKLRCLKKIAFHPGGGWGRVYAPASTEIGGEREGDWIIPAAVLDACLVACGVFGKKILGKNQLPQAFASLKLGRLPRKGEICTLYLQLKGRGDNNSHFDFTLFGDDKTVILDVEDHCCVLVSERKPG